MADERSEIPEIQVLTASATPGDIAVVVAVLSAAGGGPAAAPVPEQSHWAGRARPGWRDAR